MGRATKAVRVRVNPVLPQGQLDTEHVKRYADARLKSLTRSRVHALPAPTRRAPPGPGSNATASTGARRAAAGTRAVRPAARAHMCTPRGRGSRNGRPCCAR